MTATMVREVLDDAARARIVDDVVGHLLNAVDEPVVLRTIDHSVDKNLTDEFEAGDRAEHDERDPKVAYQVSPARGNSRTEAPA